MKLRSGIVLLVLFACSVVTLMAIAIISNKKKFSLEAEKSDAENIRYVKALKVKNDSLLLYVEGQGRVSSSRKLDISSEVQGMLLPGNKNLKPGTTFKQGEVLFQIRDTEARLSLQARKSAYLNLVANSLPDISLDFPTNFDAWKDFFEAIEITKPLPELPNLKSSKEKTFIASKNIFGDYYTIKAEEERLKKYTYVAPFNGSIIDVFAEPGSNVNPGVRLATIIKSNELEIEVPVDAKLISSIQLGANVSLSSTGGDKTFEGKVIRIGESVSAATQSIPVFISLTSGDLESVYNGMYLNARIASKYCSSCIEIPRRAVFNNNQTYLIKDSTLVKQEVEIKAVYSESFAVSGLSNAATLVIEPLQNIIDSVKIAPLLSK